MKNKQTQQNHDLAYYAGMVYRQKAWFLGVMVLTMLLGSLIIFLIPKVYSSQASILIEQETLYISSESRDNDLDLTHRVQAIFKTLLTNDSVESILRKFKILEDDVSKAGLQSALNGFKESVSLNFENAMVVNPYTGREGMASLGFTIQYEAGSPELTYEITKELTNLLFSGNRDKVNKKIVEQLEFLNMAKKTALLEIVQVENELSQYKEANSLLLPVVQSITIKRLDDLKSELGEVESKIDLLRSNADELQANIVTTRSDEGLYSPDGTRIVGKFEKLIILELEYEDLLSKYTQNHPVMIDMKEDIETLKERIKNSETKQNSGFGPANPVRELLLSRLDGTNNEIKYKIERITKIKEEIRAANRQLQKMPQIEKELQILELKQRGVVKKYEEIQTKLASATLHEGMGRANLLDNFTLLESPQYPLEPIKPRKKILLAVLLMLSIFLGILVALLKGMFSDRIVSKKDLSKYVDASIYMIPVTKQKNWPRKVLERQP
ncbi:MAG: Wzz/FepE/Etk N-terminal domain-containing protein [Gammaproteobacteria bacterium]|nr:Wzz/FepE/Etk N-terminal domain-containing protein [Gammaproteobacteria bacterium]